MHNVKVEAKCDSCQSLVHALWELLIACENQELITPFGGLLRRKMAEGREAVRRYARPGIVAGRIPSE